MIAFRTLEASRPSASIRSVMARRSPRETSFSRRAPMAGTMRRRRAASYEPMADGLNTRPPRARMAPERIPSTSASAALATVGTCPARSSWRRTAPPASARHVFASARVRKVRRIFRRAAGSQAWAW
jgi:hypothetical protein